MWRASYSEPSAEPQGLSEGARTEPGCAADVFSWGRAYMGRLERGECNLTLQSLEYIGSAIELDPILLLTPGGAP
jgi:hypothetical protein